VKHTFLNFFFSGRMNICKCFKLTCIITKFCLLFTSNSCLAVKEICYLMIHFSYCLAQKSFIMLFKIDCY